MQNKKIALPTYLILRIAHDRFSIWYVYYIVIINCNFYSYISYYLLLIPISTLDYPTYLGTFSISATRVGRAAANESPQMDSSDSQAVEDITNQNIVPSITPVPVVYPPNKVLWFHSIKMYSGAQLQRTTWTRISTVHARVIGEPIKSDMNLTIQPPTEVQVLVRWCIQNA